MHRFIVGRRKATALELDVDNKKFELEQMVQTLCSHIFDTKKCKRNYNEILFMFRVKQWANSVGA